MALAYSSPAASALQSVASSLFSVRGSSASLYTSSSVSSSNGTMHSRASTASTVGYDSPMAHQRHGGPTSSTLLATAAAFRVARPRCHAPGAQLIPSPVPHAPVTAPWDGGSLFHTPPLADWSPASVAQSGTAAAAASDDQQLDSHRSSASTASLRPERCLAEAERPVQYSRGAHRLFEQGQQEHSGSFSHRCSNSGRGDPSTPLPVVASSGNPVVLNPEHSRHTPDYNR
jgi:hypothetical protein